MSQWGRPARLFASASLLVVALGGAVSGQSTVNKGVVSDDPDFAKAVKEWTTKPEFSSPLVDHLPGRKRCSEQGFFLSCG